MKLIEEYSGVGDLVQNGTVVCRVRYRINRYQAMLASGLPLPGMHRIEGSIAAEPARDGAVARGATLISADLIGAALTLTLEDGRSIGITVADAHGRVLTEGHGPRGGCSCC